MERLTVDNPRNNREALLNYAYAKDGRVYLSYADGDAGVDLCEYIAKNACCEEIDAAAVMDGACMECDCKTAILYTVAVQAAELRERLSYYEDLEEQGRTVMARFGEESTQDMPNEELQAEVETLRAEVVRLRGELDALNHENFWLTSKELL